MKLIFILVSILVSTAVYSYPKFVGHGYNSCLICHYNSQGNGALTDYGRALSATEISGKLFRPNLSDEELGERSNFLRMKKPLSKSIRPSINYRGLLFSQNVGDGDAVGDVWSDARYINMQISANVAIKLDQKDKYIVVAEMSYNPDDISDSSEDMRSREYYFRWMPNKNVVTYAGLMDKVFGVRFENHYLFSKRHLGLEHDDQSHAVTGVYQSEKTEFTGQYFLGNLHIDGDTEQSGFSLKGVYKPSSFGRFGASFLSSSSPYKEKTFYSVHAEFGLGHGSSIITEFGQTLENQVISKLTKNGRYFSFQGAIRPLRGLYLYQTIEYLKSDLDSENYKMRLGPGLQWFVDQGLEFRLDLLNERSYSFPNPGEPGSSFNDQWELLSQVHIWL